MNLKKVLAAVAIVLLAGVGVVSAHDLSEAQIEIKLQRNEILPMFLGCGFGEKKDEWGRIAQQQIKKHRNYIAYYNAAAVYLADKDCLDDASHTLTATDVANVKKYATKAIEISPKTPDMYLVRAYAITHYLDFDVLSNKSYPGWDLVTPQVKAHRAEVQEALKDLEEVGRLQPSMAPWGKMAMYYEALGKTEDAKRCSANEEVYSKLAERKAQQKREQQMQQEVLSWFGNWFFGGSKSEK